MTNVRITKEFSFECAHSLYGYDGKCSQLHGHSYKLFVTLKGEALNSSDSPKDGMLADFRDLKEMVNMAVTDKFDHALVLMEGTPLSKELASHYSNVIILPFRPTSENLIAHFATLITDQMKADPKFTHSSLFCIKLHETATSYVEWFAQDNL
jgi:6-pyruvoyltetrahydropterin/6-carboxytetrahydropterin synthase